MRGVWICQEKIECLFRIVLIRGWGLGIGDQGLGAGGWGLGVGGWDVGRRGSSPYRLSPAGGGD